MKFYIPFSTFRLKCYPHWGTCNGAQCLICPVDRSWPPNRWYRSEKSIATCSGRGREFFVWVPPTRRENQRTAYCETLNKFRRATQKKGPKFFMRELWFCTTTWGQTPRLEHASCLLHSNGNCWITPRPLQTFICSCSTWRDFLPVKVRQRRRVKRDLWEMAQVLFLWTGNTNLVPRDDKCLIVGGAYVQR
jgi:hypothetical protein